MELKNYNVYFFFVILLAVSIITFFVFQPFLLAIFMAAIMAVIFQRPFKFFIKITRNRVRISALLTSLVGMTIFVGLFSVLVGLIVNEATSLIDQINGTDSVYETYVAPVAKMVNDNALLKAAGIHNLINPQMIGDSISQLSQGAVSLFQKTYQGIAHFLFQVVVMFFTFYYFLVGGRALVHRFMYLSPLRDAHEIILIKKFISISRATVKGTLVVGFVQGGIGGLTFAIAGVPSAEVWAVVMMFLSLIPMVGSSLIWFPAGIIMLLLGNVWQGIVILSVGFGIISIIDNLLRPELVGKDTQMHPLVVFFATLGGIALFGFLGFILGPVIVALFIALWEIYAVEFKSQLKKYNK